MRKPLTAPPPDIAERIAALELALYRDMNEARTLVAQLEQYDLIDLPKESGIRAAAAMGFFYNLSDQLPLAEKFYARAFQMLGRSDRPISRSGLLADLAGIQINLKKYKDAEVTLNLAVQALPENAVPADLALIHTRRAFLMLHFSRFDSATDLFLQGLDTLEGKVEAHSLREAYIASAAWSGLGEVYMRIGDAQKCRDAYLSCLRICESYQLKARIGWHYLNAGTSMLNEGNLEEAKRLFHQALAFADHRNVTANANANLGITLIREQQYRQAMRYFDAAEAAYGPPSKPEDYSNFSVLEMHRAQIYMHENEVEKGLKHLEQSFFHGMKGSNRRHLINVCKSLAHFHSQHGQYRQAYEYLLHADAVSIQHAEQLREEKIRELQIRHDAEQREKEAALAKAELSTLQLRALRAQFNPHFMFNALNGLANMIASHRNEEAEAFLDDFATLLRMSLELSNEEWIPLEKELAFVLAYLNMNRKLRFRGNLYYRINLPDQIGASSLSIPSMVLQPFIENAIEHGLSMSQGGNIDLSFRIDEPGILTCIITDDGIGLNASRTKNEKNLNKHKSRGMQFTQDRLDMLHQMQDRKLTAITLIDLAEASKGTRQGTEVVLLVPIKQG